MTTKKKKMPKRKSQNERGLQKGAVQAQSGEQFCRRAFLWVLFVVVGAVIAGLVPVWFTTEATRAAQHSELLKSEIAATLGVSESLELERSALLTSTRIARVATEDLLMVPESTDRSYIELNDLSLAPFGGATSVAQGVVGASSGKASLPLPAAEESALVANVASRNMATNNAGIQVDEILAGLARLTAGEASTLLVGDVGLAGLRNHR